MIESHWNFDFLGHIMERNYFHVPVGEFFSWLPQINHVPKFGLKHFTQLKKMSMLNLWDSISNPSPMGTLGRFTFNYFCKGVKMWPLNITSIAHEFEIVHNVSKNTFIVPSIPQNNSPMGLHAFHRCCPTLIAHASPLGALLTICSHCNNLTSHGCCLLFEVAPFILQTSTFKYFPFLPHTTCYLLVTTNGFLFQRL